MLVLIEELSPEGARVAFGAPLPDAAPVVYSVPLSLRLPTPLTDGAGHVRVSESDDSSAKRVAPARVIDFILAACERKSRGFPVRDPELVARRVTFVEPPDVPRELRPKLTLPPRALLPSLCSARRVLEDHARELVERLALPNEIAADLLKSKVPNDRREEWPDADLEAIVAKVAEDPEGCIYAWDSEGFRLDAEAEAARQRKEATAKEIEAERARDARINGKTSAALGVFVFSASVKCEWHALAVLGQSPPTYTDGFKNYWVYELRELCGLKVPAGPVMTAAGEILPPSFVPLATRKELREGTKTLNDVAIQYLFAVRETANAVDKKAIESWRDLSTVEGQHAVSIFASLAGPFVRRALEARTMGDTALAWKNESRAVNLALRGLRLRPDVAHAELVRIAIPIWEKDIHPFQDRFVQGPYGYTDEKGNEVGVPAVRWSRPAFPITEARFNEVARRVLSGAEAFVSPDEVWREPTADERERIGFRLGVDPWKAPLERFVSGKDLVSTDEIESALQASKVLTGKLPNSEGERVRRLLGAFGFEYARVPMDGSHKRRFVRMT